MVPYQNKKRSHQGRALSVSAARRDLFRLVDRVLSDGSVVEIERHGKRVQLVAVEQPVASKFQRLVRRSTVVGDPADLAEASVWDEAAWRSSKSI